MRAILQTHVYQSIYKPSLFNLKAIQVVLYGTLYSCGYVMPSLYLLTRIRLVELISRGLLLDILFTMLLGALLLKRKYGTLNMITISIVCAAVLVLEDIIYLQT